MVEVAQEEEEEKQAIRLGRIFVECGGEGLPAEVSQEGEKRIGRGYLIKCRTAPIPPIVPCAPNHASPIITHFRNSKKCVSASISPSPSFKNI